MMKRCLIDARSILGQDEKADAEGDHDLTNLWNALWGRVSKPPLASRLADSSVLKGGSQQTEELRKHDPFAIGCRYSTGRDGKLPLFNLDAVSMHHFQQVVERLVTCFNGMLAWLMEENRSRSSLRGQ